MVFLQTIYTGDKLPDDLFDQCAGTFSNEYGVWGASASAMSPSLKPGSRVKMSGQKLKKECASVLSQSVVAICRVDGDCVGHAVGVVWDSKAGRVGWVTQLVVAKAVRRRYIASLLVTALREDPLFKDVKIMGVVSSNPITCRVVAKCAGVRPNNVDLDFTKQHAPDVLENSPIAYLKSPRRGSLFEERCGTGAVSLVDTKFFVDHDELLQVLSEFQRDGEWCLGDLLEGHEFLLMVPMNRRSVIE